MKIVKNDDGTVSVTIPKSDEVYDTVTGGLFVTETLSEKDFATAIGGAAKPAAKRRSRAKAPAKPAAKRRSRAKAPAKPASSPTPAK